MAAVAAHPLESPENLLEPVYHGLEGDEAEVARGDDRHELKPDVRRRRPPRNDRLRIFLEVVRREPLGFLGDELLEVLPVQLRVAECGPSLGLGEPKLRWCRGRAEQIG